MMSKISIIIPIFNVEKYIRQALDSVVNQTLKDIEIICINDCTPDNSFEIVKEYAQNDKRFVLIEQEKNQGQGVARNVGIEKATGEYIMFLDPDDWLELDACEKIYKYFKETNGKVIYFNHTIYTEDDSIYHKYNIQKDFLKKYKYDISKTNIYTCKDLGNNCFIGMGLAACTKAYCTSYVKNNNIKFAPYKYGEDQIFNFMGVLCTDKIYYLDDYLYFYRIRFGSAVNRISKENFCIFENLSLIKNFLIEKKLLNCYEKEYKNFKITVLSWHYNSIPIENKDEYKEKTKNLLDKEEYKKFLELIKNNNSKLENIFSIKNKRVLGEKHKIVTILGFSFTFKPKKRRDMKNDK